MFLGAEKQQDMPLAAARRQGKYSYKEINRHALSALGARGMYNNVL
jgi:hypothetical protein